MTVRMTSIEAYNDIRDNGLLGKLQFEVYEVLYNHGPLTQGELWSRFFPNAQRHSIAPRFAELKDRGVVVEVGERPCQITGVNSIVWDVTDHLPTAPVEKQRGARKILTELLERVSSLEKTIKMMQEGRYEPNGQATLFGNGTYGKGH